MRALSLTQPWATLVAHGFKRIETRDWATRYRGPLAIHASKYRDGADRICYTDPFAAALLELGYASHTELPQQAVLCIVRLVDVLRVPQSPTPPRDSAEFAFGDYSNGRYMWVFDQVEAFEEPVAQRGFAGLWDWPLPPPERLHSHPVEDRSRVVVT